MRTQVAASWVRAASRALRSARSSLAAIDLVAGVAAPGIADDQVAFEPGGVLLQRAEHAADVGTTLGAGRDVGRALDQLLPLGGGAVTGARRLEGDLVAQAFQLGAEVLDPGGAHVGAGHQRQRGPQLRGERVGEPGRLRQRHGEGAGPGAQRGVERAVEATPDQGREPLPLLPTDPAAVEGRRQQLVAVGHRLPQGHREGHVAGDVLAASRSERGGVELVELGTTSAHPLVELLEVELGRAGVDRVADAAGCGGRAGHGWRPYWGRGCPGDLPRVGASQVR